MGKALDFREREVLRIVVEHYTDTGEGSNSFYVAERLPFNLSPSTVRNIMASLQAKGYLKSMGKRGKFPTDKALREHIQNLIKTKPWKGLSIKFPIEPASTWEEVLKEAAKNLSRFSGTLSLLVSPSIFHFPFSHIKLLRTGENTVLILLRTPSGILLTQGIRTPKDYTQRELDQVEEILNREYRMMTLQEVATRLRLKMGNEIRILAEILEGFHSILQKMDILVEGEILLLDRLEGSIDKIKEILRVFENKKEVLDFLENLNLGDEIQVLWGEELPFPYGEEWVFLLYPYSEKGIAAVFGPKHMKYSKALQALDLTGQTLKKIFVAEAKNGR